MAAAPPASLTPPPDRWAELVERFAAGAPTADDLAHFARAFAVYRRERGAMSLERCLGLPTTEGQYLRQRRDEHLRAAAAHAHPRDGWPRAEYLVAEWSRMLNLTSYARWREQGEPDADALAVRRELFWCSTFNRHQLLGVRSVFEIVGK